MKKKNYCKCYGNRTARVNEELFGFHREFSDNLNSIYGAFGTIKWNRAYNRAGRKGLKGLIFELPLISCGFCMHKYHLKRNSAKSLNSFRQAVKNSDRQIYATVRFVYFKTQEFQKI